MEREGGGESPLSTQEESDEYSPWKEGWISIVGTFPIKKLTFLRGKVLEEEFFRPPPQHDIIPISRKSYILVAGRQMYLSELASQSRVMVHPLDHDIRNTVGLRLMCSSPGRYTVLADESTFYILDHLRKRIDRFDSVLWEDFVRSSAVVVDSRRHIVALFGSNGVVMFDMAEWKAISHVRTSDFYDDRGKVQVQLISDGELAYFTDGVATVMNVNTKKFHRAYRHHPTKGYTFMGGTFLYGRSRAVVVEGRDEGNGQMHLRIVAFTLRPPSGRLARYSSDLVFCRTMTVTKGVCSNLKGWRRRIFTFSVGSRLYYMDGWDLRTLAVCESGSRSSYDAVARSISPLTGHAMIPPYSVCRFLSYKRVYRSPRSDAEHITCHSEEKEEIDE